MTHNMHYINNTINHKYPRILQLPYRIHKRDNSLDMQGETNPFHDAVHM